MICMILKKFKNVFYIELHGFVALLRKHSLMGYRHMEPYCLSSVCLPSNQNSFDQSQIENSLIRNQVIVLELVYQPQEEASGE